MKSKTLKSFIAVSVMFGSALVHAGIINNNVGISNPEKTITFDDSNYSAQN
jgi:hypothetical protein